MELLRGAVMLTVVGVRATRCLAESRMRLPATPVSGSTIRQCAVVVPPDYVFPDGCQRARAWVLLLSMRFCDGGA